MVDSDMLLEAWKSNEDLGRALLDDWASSVSDPWDEIITLEEKRSQIESYLPLTSDEEFEEYVLLWNQLGVLYTKVGY